MMNDMIPRSYALSVIENQEVMKAPESEDSLVMEAYKSGYRDALEQMKMDIRAIKVKTEWNVCSDRMPSVKGNYLVCTETGEVKIAVHVRGHWAFEEEEILAWMPLPKRYISRRKRK